MLLTNSIKTIKERFNGLLPIVIDVETSGLDPATDALLELAAVSVSINTLGKLQPAKYFSYQVEAFPGANLSQEALDLTGIKPFYPLRYAIPERQALERFFYQIRLLLALHRCQRAVLVGHNAWFDLHFLRAAIKRSQIYNSPFHSFTTFDTATLAGVTLGETVLAKAVKKAGLAFDINQAHSAIYDVDRTARLFCHILNKF